MSRVTIRPFSPKDLQAVLTLLAQPDMDDGRVLSEPEAQALIKQIEAAPHHQVYVAETDGSVVGTFALIVVQHLAHRGARSAIIEDVVVRTDRQGQGVGRMMMNYAAERARESRCYKLMLSSGGKRKHAHAFYEGLGFERHGHSFLLEL